ncbi:LPS-assembly protein LptD [Phaeobacter gallaeciensis]|uniref:LPS-assembly protein LptD n=2 Tax=Roseobacteraceae TaxID=2854170 RepID=A0A366WR89_9RHOB|nr:MULTISPECIES: LPS assembly protein LptD [Roseobacteraceae]MBT3140791.1 LPS assembly protein LptD [Falsiruegeria litorea]MBT8170535.1 LPS assembly protein LptD [Falsiruegeria litorea]RBW52748.1 LPS-assembly protein LptD [Phaeobacter gallaeciensis]
MRQIASLVLSSVCFLGLSAPLSAQSAPAVSSNGSAEAVQPPAMLVADSVFITPDRQLIAKGNVEAFQGDTRLRAREIVFDRESGKLTITGPIRIDQGGTVTVLANSAELDEGLQNGILSGARVVFDQQLQLAALQMTRVGGRYSQLYKTSVTSCHICEDGKPPLWQIRAQKVTHDQLEQQLYFENAQFRVLDVPIFYLPGMRLPDPNLKRASGFLIPSWRTTSQLGTGIKVPYFFKLGDHRDLTVTPYISSKTKTLDFRFRQAFRRGRIELLGAYTRDDLYPNEDRGFFYATGDFDLANSFKFEFDLKTVSDNAYLVDYGLPNLDRLRSEIAITRVKRDSAFRASVIHYETLRDSENEDQIPSNIIDVGYEKRLFPTSIGGEVRLNLDLHGHQRTANTDILGRDVTRFTADAEWLRNWTFAHGLRVDLEMGASIDKTGVSDDSTYPSSSTRSTPRAALTLRYPMTRSFGAGMTHFIEPIFQMGWSNTSNADVPNDESNYVEFDQGNLLSLSRFPAPDRREDGAAAVVGLNWAGYSAAKWQAFATVGQIFRQKSITEFSKTSGLSGTSSDILLAGQLRLDEKLALTARGLVNNSLNFSKAEVRGEWTGTRSNLSGSYLWLGRDPQENRTLAVSEFWFDGGYQVTPNWKANANLRYDIEDSRATGAGVGLVYQNECVTVNISLNRRYTSTTSIEPSTDFGFTIALNGFAVQSGNKEYRRSCRKS